MATPVFRDYDQRALDAEYNNRVKVKDAMEWIARYGGESARARAELPMRFDVPYGSHHGERLDIFPAARPGPAPVHVFIHGGYWHRLDKADFSFVARALRPAGAVTVVLNYALVPSVDLDEQVRQCRAAIAWVHRHAAQWDGDPARVSVSGHSAGGHLAAMLLTTDWSAFGVPGDVVKAVCAISGIYDLEPIRLCYLNEALALTPDVVRRTSPARLAPRAPAPLLLALGAAEGPEYHRQTTELAAAWRAHGVPIELMDLEDHDHFSIVGELQSPFSALAQAIQRQAGLG